jgi:hypothetical protein
MAVAAGLCQQMRAEVQLSEVEDEYGVVLLALLEQLARALVVFGGMFAGEFLHGGWRGLRHCGAPKRQNDYGD